MSNGSKSEDLFDSFQKGLNDIGKKVGSFVDDVLSSDALSSELKVRSDVYFTKTEYIIEMELAGVQKSDVGVLVIDGILQVKGDKKATVSEQEVTFQRRERQFGAFLKSYPLPENVDQEGIKAKFSDNSGLLTIRFPLNDAPETEEDTGSVDIE